MRAMGAASSWGDRGSELVEAWQRAALCASAASCWLSLRLQASSGIVVAAAALLAVLQREVHSADPGIVTMSDVIVFYIGWKKTMVQKTGTTLNTLGVYRFCFIKNQ